MELMNIFTVHRNFFIHITSALSFFSHGECPTPENTETFIRICENFNNKNPTELIGMFIESFYLTYRSLDSSVPYIQSFLLVGCLCIH